MCRHILNAKVYVQAACCLNWFECSECHDELCDHRFKVSIPLRLTCKQCRRASQIDLHVMMETDKQCEQCGTVWCLAGVTPEKKLFEESMHYLHKRLEAALDREEILK